MSDNFRSPQTSGERAADRSSQQQDRARQAHKEQLQRKLQFLQSRLEAAWEYNDQATERRLSAQIQEVMLELDMVRGDTVVLKDADPLDRLEGSVTRGLQKAAEYQQTEMSDSFLSDLSKEDEPVQKGEVDLSDPLGLYGDSFGVRR